MCEVIEVTGIDARIEIHKAGMDFKVRKGLKKNSSLVSPSSLYCPSCSKRKITILDQGEKIGNGDVSYVDVSGSCESCGTLFGAKYYLQSRKIVFHETKVT